VTKKEGEMIFGVEISDVEYTYLIGIVEKKGRCFLVWKSLMLSIHI
jgi:hypothetical protein